MFLQLNIPILLAASPLTSGVDLLLVAFACGLAAVAGFFGGVCYLSISGQRREQAVLATFPGRVETVLNRLDQLATICAGCDAFSSAKLTAHQQQQLIKSSASLSDLIKSLLSRFVETSASKSAEPETPEWDPASIPWVYTPEDRLTGLPDRTAWDANLLVLNQQLRSTDRKAGLLLVRINRFETYQERYGTQARTLLKKFALVLCRSSRETDLVCQGERSEVFAVLMPATDAAAGERAAASIRKVLQNYRFRLDEDGPDILMPFSLGFAMLQDGEHPDLAKNRALQALQRSERLGSNQLHFHNGATLAHCGAN